MLRTLQSISRKVDSLGVESRGIERCLPCDRSTSKWVLPSIAGLWNSGCGGLTSMSSFFLGPLLFGLGYKDSLVVGLLGMLLGCLLPAYAATLGPRSGLRQLCLVRYLFGRFAIKVVCLISVIGLGGWTVTNSVIGGQILLSMSNGKVPVEIGILIISLLSVVVSIFGIRLVLKLETVVGVVVIVTVILMYPMTRHDITQFHENVSVGDRLTVIGNRLCFFTLCYSVTATWAGIASDYYILLPETFSQKKVFFFTLFSIAVPTTVGAVIGLLIGNAAVSKPTWAAAYETSSLGGLLNLVFDAWGGFGKFLLILLWLSLMTNNIINLYSSALIIQIVDPWVYRNIPRWFMVLVVFAVTLVLAMAGRDKLSTILSNFLPMLGYWITIYFVILVEENVIFRSTKLVSLFRFEFSEDEIADEVESKEMAFEATVSQKYGQKPYYNFAAWDSASCQTYGIAASLAFCMGAAGAVLGMDQVYYIGVLARKIGDYGGDIGTWLILAFTGLSYPVLRYAELRIFGK
ncbi:hypothetical protein KL905_003826 [Ogataea polymorpha]|uniref:Uncharacterized protein n=1 Tax=Ogataea polymorpha TaxID=460523 RepID=A0A1B7SFC8_9ASCO|nr:uncharacterized protein OGAPODRAFT_16973 [Ogataea polymorpha]KAG7878333.1 hypothetical protein KL937_004075 [Ogataea polymorpha]KAG7890150.1 hypothetical protein KL908_004488 [Ogataea polymorpha]KAG7898690.1 hypothetical protein KL935_004289 [Ogataea polymorpha]KAG7907153.1 hypothetical protein KL906_004339 [Ogataea polymorpha]KAG7914803.1 hypothetical protein KL927_004472 [Ogataea polymorpha]